MSFPFDLHSAAVYDSRLPRHAHPCSDNSFLLKATAQHGRLSTAVLCCGLEKNGMVEAWHGHGMASVNKTRPHCVNQMGKTHSKLLAARHGRGTAWSRHWHGMLCVNRPEVSVTARRRQQFSPKLCYLSTKQNNDTSYNPVFLQMNVAKTAIPTHLIPFPLN